MFRADPHANEACRDPPQHRKPLQQAHRERHLHLPALERPSQKLILNRQLGSLNHTRRQLAAALDTPQIIVRQAAGRERRRRMLAAATASWIARLIPPRRLATSHGRRRRCTRVPACASVPAGRRHRQQLDIVPVVQLLDAVVAEMAERSDSVAKASSPRSRISSNPPFGIATRIASNRRGRSSPDDPAPKLPLKFLPDPSAVSKAASTGRQSARRDSTTSPPVRARRMPSVGADDEVGIDLDRSSGVLARRHDAPSASTAR